MTRKAVDTCVAVALLVSSRWAHPTVSSWARGRSLVLSGHALAETYSVLTRLPGDARVAPSDAVASIDAGFEDVAVLDSDRVRGIHRGLAERGIAVGRSMTGSLLLSRVTLNCLWPLETSERGRPMWWSGSGWRSSPDGP